MVPPLPEKYPNAPDNEVVESVSELPSARSPAEDADESSEDHTRKRSRSSSESSDASTPPTPRNPLCLDRHCRGNGHGRCCNRQRVVERGARAASSRTRGKDLLLIDCIDERVQRASSTTRRRVAGGE